MRQAFITSVARSLHIALSAIASQMFQPRCLLCIYGHQGFASAPETVENVAATTSPDVITVSLRFVRLSQKHTPHKLLFLTDSHKGVRLCHLYVPFQQQKRDLSWGFAYVCRFQ